MGNYIAIISGASKGLGGGVVNMQQDAIGVVFVVDVYPFSMVYSQAAPSGVLSTASIIFSFSDKTHSNVGSVT